MKFLISKKKALMPEIKDKQSSVLNKPVNP